MNSRARVLRTFRSRAFSIQTVEFGSGFSLPRHAHEWTCFQVVLRGAFVELGISDTDSFDRGTLVFRPAGTEHQNPRSAASSVSVCVQLNEWRADLPSLRQVNSPQIIHSAEILAIAERIADELERPDDLTPTVIDAACLQLLGTVVRRSRGAPDRTDAELVRRAQALIDARGVSMGVQSLAQRLNVSRHQLHRIFARATGHSVSSYLRQHRLFEARRLLEETPTPISEVAFLTGFADQSHLTRHFKAAFGRTPSRVRRATVGGTDATTS